jgi:hypothetical protein
MRQRQLPELVFEPRRGCPARRPISLASAYLVRVAGSGDRGSSGVGWSAIICIASDSHISYIYIYIHATAIFIFNFITALTSGHNLGPDALARKQCRARVLAVRARSAVPQ